MQIEILLDPKSASYSDFIDDLQRELRELKGLEYKEIETPAPPKTLNVTHDIIKLVFAHGADALRLVTTLLQLLGAVSDRVKNSKGKASEPSTPTVLLKVDDRTLAFPAADGAQRSLLDAVRRGKTKRKITAAAATKKARAKKKKQR